MTLYQNILMWVSLAAAFSLAAAGVVVWCDMRGVLPGRRILHAFMRLPWLVRLFLVAFVVQLVVHGSTKTNQTNGVEGGTTNAPTMMGGVPAPGVGHARYGVVQPEPGRVPTGAVLAQNQWRRGCWEDWLAVSFEDGWVFPHGTNRLSHVAVMTQGELRTGVRDTDAVASLGAKVAHVPFDTCFYHEHTPSNTYRFVWDRVYIDRNTNAPMYAAIELFRNGDTCVTTNGVATFTPREIPFPHIGIGQNDDWVRTNFVNAADILSVGYAEWVDSQVGVDLENGLYKFTATFPDAPPEATQLTVGDLSVVITNAGEYVFLMEKGVEYAFGTTPYDATVEYSMQDDVGPDAEIVYPAFSIFNSQFPIFSWWWGDPAGEWTVDGGWDEIYPPTLFGYGTCLWLPTLCGSPDVNHLGPNDFPMTFTALLTDFCRTNDVTYHWSSGNDNIHIVSPYAQSTEVQANTLPSWDHFSMSVDAYIGNETLTSTILTTYGTNDAPRVSASIGCQSVVFVNDDHRSGRFYWVGVGISCEVATNGHVKVTHAGDTGPVFYSDRGTNRIELLDRDFSIDGAVDYGFYVACTNCGRGQFAVECATADGEVVVSTNSYRVIEPVCSVVCNDIEYFPDARFVNPCCLVRGEQSRVRVGVARGEFSSREVQWTVQGAAEIRTNGWDLLVTPATSGDTIGICASFNDDEQQPILVMPVVSKRRIPIRGFIVSHPDEADVDAGVFDVMVEWANVVYKQAGIEFFITNVISNVGTTNMWKLTYTKWIDTENGRRQVLSDEALSLLNTYDAGDCIEIYLVGSVRNSEVPDHGLGTAAFWTPRGIIVGRDCYTSLAHELGHALGLSDCYGSVGGVELSGLKDPVSASLFNNPVLDFYDGASGRGFYKADETKQVVLKRLLMYGISDGGGSDIPAGNVVAFPDMESSNPTSASIGVGYSSIKESNVEVYSR